MGGRSIFGAGMAMLLAAATLLLAAPAASAFIPEQEQRLQRVVEDYREELRYPGLVVGVWQQGRGGFTTAVGQANRATGRSMTTNDHFAIGSNTKTLTATLVLQLVQRGEVKLSDPLSKYVAGVPLGRLITIRMLLNHTSGLHDGPSQRIQKDVFRHPHRSHSPSQLLRKPVRAPRAGLPGEVWQYSNTGYWLLGKIVHKVTDQPLGHLYERRIFDRVGMGETGYRPHLPVPEPAAHGYIGCAPIRQIAPYCAGRPQEAAVDTTDWNRSWAWAAGAATSTLENLRRWAPALVTGRGLLNHRVQRKRLSFTSAIGDFADAGEASYGLGIAAWELSPSNRVPACESETLPATTLYGHNGSVYGYDSESWYDPQSKLTIVALGNAMTVEDPIRPSHFGDLGLNGLIPCLAAAVAD